VCAAKRGDELRRGIRAHVGAAGNDHGVGGGQDLETVRGDELEAAYCAERPLSHTRSSARRTSAPNRSAPRSAPSPRPEHVIRFGIEPVGAVHQQWAWPPICVAARGDPGRPLSEADVVWPSTLDLSLTAQ
jgi:hypothetical protein